MAEIINLPKQVHNGNWRDDIATEPNEKMQNFVETVGYATYGDDEAEMRYVSPKNISKESIERIKQREIRLRKLGRLALWANNNKHERLAA